MQRKVATRRGVPAHRVCTYLPDCPEPVARPAGPTGRYCTWKPGPSKPARPPRASSPRRTDHPRSRGVHLETQRRVLLPQGSSPLARGALEGVAGVDVVGEVGARIIPARAGCTPRHPRSRPAPRDHPRSRGVHATLVGPGFCHTGSSPLARGALTKNLKTSGGIGIIPARAGCTRRGVHVMAGVRDHPRSRGVHPGGPVLTGLSGGSSPLARGAPVECCAPDVAGRIIPARAGCTLRRPRRSAATRDHPRSRGVHFTASRAFSNAVGSSPLARGALATITGHTPQNRIIPARAGCTCTKNDSWRRVADHPRSRGVHLELTDGGRRFRGSSPLARGARSGRREPRRRTRIIPARAGCTRARYPSCRAVRDHPRSRGVHVDGSGG